MRKKRDWLWEFSKKIVWIVTIMFIITFAFSFALLIFYPDSMALQFVIESISKVFIATVVSYAVKAGFENVFKIKKGESNYEQCGDDYFGDDFNSRAN